LCGSVVGGHFKQRVALQGQGAIRRQVTAEPLHACELLDDALILTHEADQAPAERVPSRVGVVHIHDRQGLARVPSHQQSTI